MNSMIYNVSDIQKILGLSRSKAYAYVQEVHRNQSPFRVIRIGNLYRIPKIPFDYWIQHGAIYKEDNEQSDNK